MMFSFAKPEFKTPSGLTVRATSSPFALWKTKSYYNTLTSPIETILCRDIKQSMYCQLLCGLVQRDHVIKIGSIFAPSVLQVIKIFEDHWKELCLNIQLGRLSDWITDKHCRDSVSSILNGSNPKLADSIRYECDEKSWEGIVKRIWPRAKYIQTIVTGTMAQYIPMLNFYCGDLPLVSPFYGSSECMMGINMMPACIPHDVSYTLIPNMAYFEFISVEKDQDAGDEDHAVDLVNVKVGHSYELLVTTFAGLYRLKVGDILTVTGFHNNAPKFKFLQRQNVVLSIDTVKTEEKDLINAVKLAKDKLEPHGLMLVEYTSYAEVSTFPSHYVFFWEIMAKKNNGTPELDSDVLEECCFIMEQSFGYLYGKKRRYDEAIGPLEIRVVSHGTFHELMDFFVSRGSSVNQYKTPRCIKSEEALKLLNSKVVHKFLSQKAPSWEPFAI